jgi:hypothetical protein
LWLQEDPDATAKSLLVRLRQAYPDRFPEGQLRTLQRRIGEWRRLMAHELVFACLSGEQSGETLVVVGSREKEREQPSQRKPS